MLNNSKVQFEVLKSKFLKLLSFWQPHICADENFNRAQLLPWTPSASTEVTWAAATQPEQPLFAGHWRRNRCDGKYTAIIKDHRNHYCSKYGVATLHILRMLLSFGWWPGWSLGSQLLCVATPITQCSGWISESHLSFLLNTASNLGNFISALKSFQSEIWNNLPLKSSKDTIN